MSDNLNRDSFTGKWGFILACIGSAVGMGNIWRFPVLVSAWGGMTFLIPYFIFVILIGSTGVIEEFALGRMAAAGPMGAFAMATGRRGKASTGAVLGLIPILGSLLLAIGYTCVMGWIVKYTWMSLDGSLYAMGQDMGVIGGTFESTASAFGANFWIILTMLISFGIMCMGIAGGIEKANKFMMPVLFVLFLGLGIYIAMQPGSAGGYKYIFTVNPEGLADPKLWIFAFGQAFFSLSVAGSGSVIYGSYLPKNEDIPASAKNVAFFDTMAALLAAFVIIPAMAVGGAELSEGGPGLMFIYLVNVINGMTGGHIVGIIFYVCVLFAGISSIVNLYETPVAFMQEKFKLNRVMATGVIHVIGCIVAIMIQAIVSDWMDFISIYMCPLGALLAGVMFFHVLPKEEALSAVNMGAKTTIGDWFYPLGKYLYCAMALIALIAGAILGGIG
ncbi:sodium-dependent transporter [Peptoniphilus equinus]|uniref:Sodium-dependent transporter n=1 Tax=Peptoniphilus equinus TaxID=3016343 RepID=A0ABY7QU37_9FIRM|nr:sodium-dependent transporter [Peptoniphilus equinus]WBW50247.1 sodium-dependent transporter [Peptoniphilus equinus]